MLIGCDVSHHQSSIDALIDENDFFIIKATEGRTYRDPKFTEHMTKALKAKKLVGVYHFARPDNGNTAEDEAANFVRAVEPYLGTAILALDYETKAWNHGEAWALAFLREVYRLTGVRPVIYCNASKEVVCPTIAAENFGLWHVQWGKNDGTAPLMKQLVNWNVWALWQFTSKPYDRDYFNGTAATWAKYAKSVKKDESIPEALPGCQCEICKALRELGYQIR